MGFNLPYTVTSLSCRNVCRFVSLYTNLALPLNRGVWTHSVMMQEERNILEQKKSNETASSLRVNVWGEFSKFPNFQARTRAMKRWLSEHFKIVLWVITHTIDRTSKGFHYVKKFVARHNHKMFQQVLCVGLFHSTVKYLSCVVSDVNRITQLLYGGQNGHWY